MPLHVGAVFIVLSVSAVACALPIVALKVPRLHIPQKAHFVFRHFGTGVLIATAFVHLLPTAFISLTNACLPPFFNEEYPALAGAIALAAVFLITIVEMIFNPHRDPDSGIEQKSNGQTNDPDVPIYIHGAGPVQIPEMGRIRSTRSFSYLRTLHRSEDACTEASCEGVRIDRPYTVGFKSQEASPSDSNTDCKCDREQLAMQCVLLECGAYPDSKVVL